MKDDEADRGSASKALQALRVAVGVVRLYPDPTSQPGMERAIGALEALELPIRLDVTAKDFRLSGTQIPQDGQVQKIASSLFDRGVEELHLRSVPESQEFISFTKLISVETEEVEEFGGAAAFLASEGVTAIKVVERNLEVIAADVLHQEPDYPPLPQLLQGQKELAETLEAFNDPAAALAHLEALFVEGQAAGVDAMTLQAGIADTIAELSERTRASLMGSIMRNIDAPLPQAIIGQLSDGEISDALVILANDVDPDSVMGFAGQIVAQSRGRRGELPVILARKLLAAGLSTVNVIEVARSLGGDAALTIQDAEDEIDLAELRGESLTFYSDAFEGGILTMRALLQVEDQEPDFERLVQHVEDSIGQWILEHPDRSLALLELLTEMSISHSDPNRRARLDQALKNSLSSDLAGHFLTGGSGLGGETSRRFLSAVGQRSIPFLLEQLGNEQDQRRRKSIIEFVVDLASSDISLVLPALSDPKWFLVRNVATILGKTKRPEALPYLVRLLKHSDARVRREAVRSIGGYGNDGLGSLAQSLSDPDSSVRLSSIAALGAIDVPDSSDHLSGFTLDKRRSLAERKEALDSLRLHSSSRAQAALKKASRNRWPPFPANLELARHARMILDRSGPR